MKSIVILTFLFLCNFSFAANDLRWSKDFMQFEICQTDDFTGPQVTLTEYFEEQGSRIEAQVAGQDPIIIFKQKDTDKGVVYFGKKFFLEVYYNIPSTPALFVGDGVFYHRGVMYFEGDVTTAYCQDRK